MKLKNAIKPFMAHNSYENREVEIYVPSMDANLDIAPGADTDVLKNQIFEMEKRIFNTRDVEGADPVIRLANDETGTGLSAIQQLGLLGQIDVEIGAHEIENEDVSSKIFTPASLSRNDWTQPVNINSILDPVAPFGLVKGNNDEVPQMSFPAPKTDQMEVEIKGVGVRDSFNKMFDTLYDFQKCVRAATRGYIDEKNKELIDPILGNTTLAGTTPSANIIAADTTGSTLDLQYYRTIKKGLRALRKLSYLLYPSARAGDLNGKIHLLCNGYVAGELLPITKGVIDGASTPENVGALDVEIEKVRFYNAGKFYGNKTLTAQPLDDTAFYLIMTDPILGWLRAAPVDIRQESGVGSALKLSPKENAWARVAGTFLKYALPQSAGNGLIVKCLLPS
ncbi:hypothetical protein AGMMS49940_15320 [Spirochaetia bacterium]|nr:hypothetical protein AGMMS49940_15320 [Spirochaetia bacterium]